jgi:hypothetical protein
MRIVSWCLVVVAVALSGCAQFTTSKTERAGLEAAAAQAGEAYVNCMVEASQRYQQSGESAAVIADVSRKACASARSAYEEADTTYLESKFMRTEPVVTRDLAALDERATALISEQVLERKAAAPTAAVAMSAAAIVPPNGKGYLDCMRAQGKRYAGVNEPAEVVAEVAHSRCAATLTDPAAEAALERQGRALVMGMVLDRKVGQ